MNTDCMKSFYLLGDALEAQGGAVNAISAFDGVVEIRSRNVSSENWEAGKFSALWRLEFFARKLMRRRQTIARNNWNECMLLSKWWMGKKSISPRQYLQDQIDVSMGNMLNFSVAPSSFSPCREGLE